MDEVTILDLKDYRHLKSEIRSIDDELEWVYYPIASPNGRQASSYSSDPSDPTARAFRKAEHLKARRQRLVSKIEQVDYWLLTLDDHQLAAICRARYVLGRSWGEISRTICNSDNPSTARMIVTRYFGTS